MELTHRSTSQQIIQRIGVVDGPVLPMPGSNTGKVYRVEYLLVTYVQRDGSWATQRVQLSGTVLKRDGSDSKAFTKDDAWDWRKRPGLEFASTIVDGFRPVGTVEFPFIPEA